jgi:hypothetical protein
VMISMHSRFIVNEKPFVNTIQPVVEFIWAANQMNTSLGKPEHANSSMLAKPICWTTHICSAVKSFITSRRSLKFPALTGSYIEKRKWER